MEKQDIEEHDGNVVRLTWIYSLTIVNAREGGKTSRHNSTIAKLHTHFHSSPVLS